MNITVIKLGGSLVSPSREKLFDFDYLKGLRERLLPHLQAGKKFFFVLGGGSLMRMYRDLAKEAGIHGEDELHWIGTTVNVLNAEIFRAYFSEFADEGVFKYEDYYDNKPIEVKKGLKAGGGGRPGHSGDMDATLAALKCQSDIVINLKNIDHIYSADPKIDPNATKIDDLTWEQYLQLIGNPSDHEPGGNYPIDPVTSRLARDKNIKMVVMSGWDLDNFAAYLSDKAYEGTLVHN